MLTVDGIPAHPLVVHAVVVLLPLAAVGTLLVVARPVWRRELGVWVLLLALVGVVPVPVAQRTGAELAASFGGGSPLVAIHATRAAMLLPAALVYLLLLAATVLAATVLVGRRADAARPVGRGAAHARATRTDPVPLHRATLLLGVLAALSGAVVTGLVVWIGHAGSVAVWLS
jgi:preprotein translocase subunit SecG